MTSIAEALADTRDYIDKNGWHQGSFHAEDGDACCIRGATHRVYEVKLHSLVGQEGKWQSRGDGLWYDMVMVENVRNFLVDMLLEDGVVQLDPRSASARLVRGREGKLREVVAYFNDEVLTSKEEALAFLEKAQIRAEEKGL